MKKTWALVCLSAVLMMNLTACRSAGTDAGGAVSSAAVATAPDTADGTAGALLPDRMMLIGVVTEDTYTNTFFDLSWALPSGWVFADRAGSNQVAVFDPEEMIRRINAGEEYIDLYAQDPVTGGSLLVLIQGLSGYGALLALLDEETLIDETIAPAVAAMEERGAQDINAYRDTVIFRGEEVPCMVVTCTVRGIEVTQRMVFVMDGEYVAAVDMTMIGGDTGATLSAFSRIP